MSSANTNNEFNTTDDTLHATNTASGTEPATSHDTKEGGILGAVGGAVVGMLAGGPIGAVIGAVAGGAASAAAVHVVDQHDHDYDRTVGTGGPNQSITGLPTSGTTNTGITNTSITNTGYTEAATTGTGYTGTANTGAAPAPYGSTLSQNTGTVAATGEAVIPIVEEELAVGKRQVETGATRVHTGVIETPVEQSVSLHEGKVTVQRQRVDQPVSDLNAAFKEQSFEVTETAEVPVVAKQARVVEEVVVGKVATDRVETVHDTVRRTDVEVEELGTGDSNRR